MNIKGIRLVNFRGFRNASIAFKPLTILLGPNSAGKSSFGHALAAMSHAHRLFAGTPQATLTPRAKDAGDWPVDFGELGDLRTEGAKGPVKVELETSAGWSTIGFGIDSLTSLLPSYFLLPRGGGGAATTVVAASKTSIAYGPGASSGVEPVGNHVPSENAERSTSYEVQRLNQEQWQEGGTPSTVILDGLVLNAVTPNDGGTARRLSGDAQDDLKALFRDLVYLRATRKRPSRAYLPEVGFPQEIGYSGEWMATALYDEKGRRRVAYMELPAPPSALDMTWSGQFAVATEHEDALINAVLIWLNRLGLADAVRVELSDRDSKSLEILISAPSQRAHNISDIGFGVSQVLPVITAGLLLPKDSLFIVDLPEAHLHPRPQAELADFFCSLALSGRSCLVETHSEMFVKRLQLRAEMDEVFREKLAVYFIDGAQNGECQLPRAIELTGDGPVRWPTGFMRENWEANAQIAGCADCKGAGLPFERIMIRTCFCVRLSSVRRG